MAPRTICTIVFATSCVVGGCESANTADDDADSQADFTATTGSSGSGGGGAAANQPVYPGMEEIQLFVGADWHYEWEHEEIHTDENGQDPPAHSSGSLIITVTGSTTEPVETLGELTLYTLSYQWSGDELPPEWTEHHALAMQDGVLYAVDLDEDGYEATALFDAYEETPPKSRGFVGWFSGSKQLHVETEPFELPIAGEGYTVKQHWSTSDIEEARSNDVTEHYVSHVGFAGFSRDGYYEYWSSGFFGRWNTMTEAWLVSTNVEAQ